MRSAMVTSGATQRIDRLQARGLVRRDPHLTRQERDALAALLRTLDGALTPRLPH